MWQVFASVPKTMKVSGKIVKIFKKVKPAGHGKEVLQALRG